jgi:hypothetical protein
MSKRNKNKQHRRSKASKKASRKRRSDHKETGRTRFVPASNLTQADPINEIVHSFRACDLGSSTTPGLMGLSLAAYVKSVRDRLLNNEAVKPNIFFQFGYSFNSVNEFAVKREMHAAGGANVPLSHLVFADSDDIRDLVLGLERTVREIVAQMNEENEEMVKTVHLFADETELGQDAQSAFGIPQEIIDPSGRIEKEILL